MYRTFVILRHTFHESILQPIYPLLLAIGSAVLIIFGMLPFFTLGEDTRMFESVGLDVILLFVLISTLFATSKSIFEEIEDRTMLTLMSKPVRRWEVLVGKYLGIVLAALLASDIATAFSACVRRSATPASPKACSRRRGFRASLHDSRRPPTARCAGRSPQYRRRAGLQHRTARRRPRAHDRLVRGAGRPGVTGIRADQLRAAIRGLVAEYHHAAHPPADFVPGVSPVPVIVRSSDR